MGDDGKPKTAKETMEDLRKFAETAGISLGQNNAARDSLIAKALEKRDPTPKFNWAVPLRRNIDYQSIGRKTFLVDDMGFNCGKCGFWHENKKYVHSDAECAIFGVMES